MNAREALEYAFEFHDSESANYLIEVLALEFGFTTDTILLIQQHYLNQRRYGELIRLCELHLDNSKVSIRTPEARAYYNLALAQHKFGESQAALATLKKIDELNISIISRSQGSFEPREAYYFQLFGEIAYKLNLSSIVPHALNIAIKANPSLFKSIKLLAKVSPPKPLNEVTFDLRPPSTNGRTPMMSPVRKIPVAPTSPFLFGTPSPMVRSPVVPRYHMRTPNSPDLFTTPVRIGSLDFGAPVEKSLPLLSTELSDDSDFDLKESTEITLQEGIMKSIGECLSFYESQDVFSIVSAEWPSCPTIVVLKALSFYKLGFTEQALEILNLMAEYSWHQTHADIILLISSAAEPNQARMIASRLELMLRGMNTNASLDPKIASVIWFAEAIKYQGEQQTNAAITCLENSLRSDKNPIVAFFYGCLLETLNKNAEAVALLKSYTHDVDCSIKLLDIDKNMSLSVIREISSKSESNSVKIKAVMKIMKRDSFFSEKTLLNVIENEKKALNRPYILSTAYGLLAQHFENVKKRNEALNSIRECLKYTYPSQELISVFLTILSPKDEEFCVLLALLDEFRRNEAEKAILCNCEDHL